MEALGFERFEDDALGALAGSVDDGAGEFVAGSKFRTGFMLKSPPDFSEMPKAEVSDRFMNQRTPTERRPYKLFSQAELLTPRAFASEAM
jgi:hypothetical protein